MSNRRFSVLSWENRHVTSAEQYAARIEMFYQLAIREAALIATTQQIDPTRPFRFADYPQTAARVNQFLSEMTSRITSTINEGTESEWLTANLKNDAFVESVLGTVNLPRPAVERFMSRNLEGLNAFQNRKINGLGLSDRVSRYTGQFKKELELGLDIGIGEGKSADAISRDIRKYLVEPEKLFRRVRDKRGALVLSKAATGYHPGQGVYRSSYKNAMRLARTEINMAYRESDHLRFQSLDFVVGFEVMLSPRHVITDICDDLKGRYPKEFKFVGWHPQCRCYVVSILATPAELRKLNQMILAEEDTSTFRSANEVTDVHDGFKEWVGKNTDRVARSASKPYFVRDNFKDGDIRKGLKIETSAKPAVSKPLIDLSQFIAGDVPTNKEMKAVIMEFARLKPENFAHGLEGVSIVTNRSFLMQHSLPYSPRTGQWQGQSHISMSTHSFSIGGQVFNPVEEFRGALAGMKNGVELTFNQEYALEGLWHEILHAKSNTPPRKLTGLLTERMETLNQFVARHTYPDLMDAFGAKPTHQAAILEKGYGYKSWVANFRAKLAKLGIDEQQALTDLMPALMDDYITILPKMHKYLNR